MLSETGIFTLSAIRTLSSPPPKLPRIDVTPVNVLLRPNALTLIVAFVRVAVELLDDVGLVGVGARDRAVGADAAELTAVADVQHELLAGCGRRPRVRRVRSLPGLAARYTSGGSSR